MTHISGSESMMDAVYATVVGSACAGLELDAGSDLPMHAPLATHDSLSSPLPNDTYVRYLAVDFVSQHFLADIVLQLIS